MPQRIGQFEVLDELDQGTVGTVYRAQDTTTGELVAIKLLKEHANREASLQQRFVREVSICQKLDHPNIVRHHDCGLHENRIYYAMELVAGGTLKNVLKRRGKLDWHEAVSVALQVNAALDHAHQAGIIHRDLKPGNLFLADDGKVKVGDFGLARDLDRSRLTLEGTTVGTCRYMPPEQISGQADLTGAVDLYAVGCILFEMLTGKTPFDGETIVEIFEQHLHSPPPELFGLASDCPADLQRLVDELLAKDPADRPASAGAVEAALGDILSGRPLQFGSNDDPPPTDDSTAEYAVRNLSDPAQRAHAPSSPRVASPRGWLVLGSVVAVAILVVLLAQML